MCDLAAEDVLFVLVELGEGFETRRVLGDEGTLLENRGLVLEALFACEDLDFGEELVLGNTFEGIGYPIDYGLAGSFAASQTRDIKIAQDLRQCHSYKSHAQHFDEEAGK